MNNSEHVEITQDDANLDSNYQVKHCEIVYDTTSRTYTLIPFVKNDNILRLNDAFCIQVEKKPVSSSNKGYKLLSKMGWKEGESLDVRDDGLKEPICESRSGCFFSRPWHRSLGDTKNAKELFEMALVIQEEHFGPDHPQMAAALVHLGNAYKSLGDTKKAKELFERALVIQEEYFGPDHPQVASTLVNLGSVYKSLVDAKTATELIEKSFKIFSEHFGAEHSNTIWAKQQLQSKQNKVEEKANVEEGKETVDNNQK